MQIVIAWTEDVLEWDGQLFAQDLGARPNMKPSVKAYAALWLLDGTQEDVEKASEYAAKEHARVFLYGADENDPLGRARAEVVELKSC